MAGKPKNPHGIYCLETIWFDERQPPSARSLLELLERMSGVPFVCRDINTWQELDFCLGRWVGRDMYKKDYQLGDLGILYLGFHGAPASIHLRSDLLGIKDDDGVDLDRIAESLNDNNNKFDVSGCVIHFASCSTLQAHKRVEEFKDQVGAACVSGYSKSVESAKSWAFELMYLDLLSSLLAKKNVTTGTLSTLSKKIEERPEYSGLAEELGFDMVI